MTDPSALPVEFKEVEVRFGPVHAVRGVSLRVEPGTVSVLLGPNGSGKSTLIRTALGLVHPSAGSARLWGTSIRELPDPAAVVGAALGPGHLHPGLRGRDHLGIVATLAGVTGPLDGLLAQVGLSDAARRRIRTYSLGMRQRLSLAGSLVADPTLLFWDEPTVGLDAEGVAWCQGLVDRLRARSRTVVVATNDLAFAEAVADQLTILAAGAVAASGGRDQVLGGRPLSAVVRELTGAEQLNDRFEPRGSGT